MESHQLLLLNDNCYGVRGFSSRSLRCCLRRSWLRHRIAYVVTAVLMIIMIVQFGRFLDNAAPSLVDDSAIIKALGQKNSPTLNDIWIDLKNIQEFQDFAQHVAMSRFRPAYYPLRSLAIYLFGDSFRLWYLVTFLLYAATSAALFSIVMRSFGILSAALFLLLYLGHKAWSDLIPRLGPIEIECMLFATILVWLLWNWIELGKRGSLALAVPLLLFLAAMKEPNSVDLIFIGGLLLVCGLIICHKRMALTGPVLIVVGCTVLAVLFRLTGQISRSGVVPLGGPLGDYLTLGGRDSTRWIIIALMGVLTVALITELTGYANRTSWRELLAMLIAVMSVEVFRILTFYISYTSGAGTNVIETRYGCRTNGLFKNKAPDVAKPRAAIDQMFLILRPVFLILRPARDGDGVNLFQNLRLI
jgi:hypothetical protein